MDSEARHQMALCRRMAEELRRLAERFSENDSKPMARRFRRVADDLWTFGGGRPAWTPAVARRNALTLAKQILAELGKGDIGPGFPSRWRRVALPLLRDGARLCFTRSGIEKVELDESVPDPDTLTAKDLVRRMGRAVGVDVAFNKSGTSGAERRRLLQLKSVRSD